MSLKKPEQNIFELVLSVSKKIGNAVTRNQIKRYIRQVFFELNGQLQNDVRLSLLLLESLAADNGLLK